MFESVFYVLSIAGVAIILAGIIVDGIVSVAISKSKTGQDKYASKSFFQN
jgi:hypothetical protein